MSLVQPLLKCFVFTDSIVAVEAVAYSVPYYNWRGFHRPCQFVLFKRQSIEDLGKALWIAL
jgi:hypothetical protein